MGLDAVVLPVDLFPPSPGQGALGIQVREDSKAIQEILSTAGYLVVDAQVRAERALLAELHGGRSVPVGAYAEVRSDGSLSLHAQVTSLDGTRQVAEDVMPTGASAPPRVAFEPPPDRGLRPPERGGTYLLGVRGVR
ncbi:hypothetical protein [Streptomyces sp. OE57]|uniref:hypothetical protein n=1 Tax=Streptomyces lacaronensis TaxID=3379885 RepID=UPI0039B7800D